MPTPFQFPTLSRMTTHHRNLPKGSVHTAVSYTHLVTNSGLGEMDAATVENVKWMMTYLNDCKESNVGQLFMAVQTYVWRCV